MGNNFRSKLITEGVERSPNRAMLRAVGFDDKDFSKPIIGVANGYSTITLSDGISMGTAGMKYSLISREVIADSIETVCEGQQMDGLLAIGGCDKNMPGAMIAIARLDIPSIFVYGGTIKAGHLNGKDL